MALKEKFKETINKNKGKIAAGVLAGSLLFGGLVNTTIQKKQNDDLRKEVANMQVINNDRSQEIEALKNEIASAREIVNGSTKKLDKIETLVTSLENQTITTEDFEKSVGALKDALGKEFDTVANTAVKNLERNNFSKDASLQVITQISEGIQYGATTNYENAFMNLEKIENAYKEKLAKNQVSKADYDEMIARIQAVELQIVEYAVHAGLEKAQSKTGFVQLDVVTQRDNRKVSLFSASNGNWVQRDWQDGEYIREGTYDGQDFWGLNTVMVSTPQVEHGEDANLGLSFSRDITLDSIGVPEIDDLIDIEYDTKNGYKFSYKEVSEQGDQIAQTYIKFDKTGAFDSVRYGHIMKYNNKDVYQVEEMGKVLSISQQEFEKNFKQAYDSIQALNASQAENE